MRPVVFAILLLAVKLGNAQQELYVQPISIEEGLSQSSVLSVHEDRYGFIWMGTRDGLNQYDGNRTRVFKHIIGDSLSIASNYINDITEGQHGGLWIAHTRGISYYNRTKNSFTNISFADTRPGNPEIRSVNVIDNRVWACGRSGIYIYDSVTGKLTHPSFFSDDEVCGISASRIVMGPDSSLWVATSGYGLIRYKRKAEQYQRIATLVPGLRIEDVLFHSNGRIYLATYENGVYECNDNGQIVRRWSSERGADVFTKLNNTRAIIQDKQHQVWVGGFQGIGIINPVTGDFTAITKYYGLEEGMIPSVRSLIADKNGSIWAGTYHNGAILYDNYLSRFRTHFFRPGNGATGMVSSFSYTPSGELYVATEAGYLIRYNKQHDLLQQWHLKDELQNIVIKSLFYDTIRKQLWIGTLRHGLYTLKNHGIQKVGLQKHTQAGWNDLGVINHITAAPGGLWLLTDQGGGLNLFSPEARAIVPFANQKALHEAVGKGAGRYILSLQDHSYLVATHQSGLIYFDNADEGNVEKIIPDITEVNHVASYRNRYYVSTNGQGLAVLDKTFSVTHTYTLSNGLLNNTALSTFITSPDHIWINTPSGISFFSAGKFTNYHILNGFPIAEINNGAYLQTPDPRHPFLVGGKNAWTSFSESSLYTNPYEPAVYITDMKIANRSIHTIEGFSELNLLHASMLTLNYNQSTLSFELAGLNYLMPKNNAYRYMLDDFDKEWRYADYRGIAEYSQIPPGKYMFRVQAANNDGIWSSRDHKLRIRIKPPFWETWPAYLLYAMAIIGCILIIRRNAIRSARLKHNLHLKDLEQEKADLAHRLKVKYFTDISHEIRTPLTLILSPIEEMLDNQDLKEEDKKRIKNIRYHGRSLLLLVNQLLEINRVELGKEKLQPVPVVIKEICDQMDDAFLSLAAQLQVEWKTDTSGATDTALLIDKEKLEKVILNLLTNAFKYTPPGGQVQLKVSTVNQNGSYQLKVDVTDTGQGISEDDLPYIFDRFFKGKENAAVGTGIGLSLVKTVVEDLMKGAVHVISRKGTGTHFTVVLNDIQPAGSCPQKPAGAPWQLPPEYLPYRETKEMPTGKENRDSGHKILIVEDNPDLRYFLENRLSAHYHVVAAETAEDAMCLLVEEDIDLAISDVMLPGKSGQELCAFIKSNILTSHIPVVLLTAMQNEQHKLESLDTGADDYLTKPFVFKELHLRIQNILKQRERWRILYKTKSILPEKSQERFNRVDEELLRTIEKQVDKYLDDAEYSVEQLGKDVGLSRVHLYRKLKKLTGFTPSQFLRNARLRRSIDILAVEDIRISDLAFRVGFNDPSYFVRCFKEHFGVSPTEYVKQ